MKIKAGFLGKEDFKALKRECTVEELQEYFDTWLSNKTYKYMKTFPLLDDKEENFENLYNCLISGRMSSPTQIADYIFKAYVDSDKDEVLKYVSIVDNKVKRPYELVADYIESYLLREEEKEEFESACGDKRGTKATVDYLGRIVTDRLSERFSNLVYFDDSNFNGPNKKVKDVFYEWFNANGFERQKYGENMPVVFAYGDKKVPKRQNFLLDSYLSVVKRYVDGFTSKFQFSPSYPLRSQAVERDWMAMRDILSNLYDAMTDETKNDKRIVDAKLKTDYLFDDNFYERFIKANTDKKYGEDFNRLSSAISALADGRAHKDSKEEINRFLAQMDVVKKALTETTTDKNGRTYTQPANFFKVTDMRPKSYFTSIIKLQKIFTENEELRNKLEEMRVLLRDNFAWSWSVSATSRQKLENTDELSPERVLSYTSNIGVLNLSSKDGVIDNKKMKEIATDTVKYIEENNLPKYPVCAQTIFKALAKDMEPIAKKYLINEENKSVER